MENLSAKPATPTVPLRARWKIAARVLVLVLVATCIGLGLSRSKDRLGLLVRPAGFGRGLWHGALMPLALPNLLVGDDVTIYAPRNTGRLYKLGYTLGVNACGLVCFGFFFWRVDRWRKNQLPRQS